MRFPWSSLRGAPPPALPQGSKAFISASILASYSSFSSFSRCRLACPSWICAPESWNIKNCSCKIVAHLCCNQTCKMRLTGRFSDSHLKLTLNSLYLGKQCIPLWSLPVILLSKFLLNSTWIQFCVFSNHALHFSNYCTAYFRLNDLATRQ